MDMERKESNDSAVNALEPLLHASVRNYHVSNSVEVTAEADRCGTRTTID
ncbi:hypothetical protein ACP70R_025647 [Stipagrostis hirtigluma subsp. patula]